jgi:hypothetical protein
MTDAMRSRYAAKTPFQVLSRAGMATVAKARQRAPRALEHQGIGLGIDLLVAPGGSQQQQGGVARLQRHEAAGMLDRRGRTACAGRTCYDHMAGTVAVGMHDYMVKHGWLERVVQEDSDYRLSAGGAAVLEGLGLDVQQADKARRRFACACLDWSERRSHLGGALGAGLLALLLEQAWVERDFDSRALGITAEGRRRFKRVFELDA